MSRPGFLALVLLLLASSVLGDPAALSAQAPDLAAQRLGRGYWHVFLAYAIAWILVFGWAVSIGRRLSSIERRLER